MKKPLQLSVLHTLPVIELTDTLLAVEIKLALQNGTNIYTLALVDCGANGYSFIDSSFAQLHNLPLSPTRRRTLNVVDGSESVAGAVTKICHLKLGVGAHSEDNAPFFVTKLGQYPVILGKAWLRRHNPFIDWRENYLSFSSKFCSSCLPDGCYQLRVDGAADPNRVALKKPPKSVHFDLPSLPDDQPPTAPLPPSAADFTKSTAPRKTPLEAKHIKQIGAAAFESLTRKHGAEIFSFSLFEISRLLEEDTAAEFLPHSMSQDELRVLKKWLEENLKKGFIRASSSPASSPVLFAKKPGGGLRFCVDYRALTRSRSRIATPCRCCRRLSTA